jgi:hypothetical protein
MGVHRLKRGKDEVRGLPQENYSLPIGVDFHASWLLLMLSFVFCIVLESAVCHLVSQSSSQ